MTCTELRARIENSATASMQAALQHSEVVDHARTCAGCTRFIGEQADLIRLLNLARDAAPEISPAVDSAVLAAFHRRPEPVAVGSNPFRKPMGLPANLLWRGAAAAGILAAAMGVIAYRKAALSGPATPAPAAIHPASTPASIPAVAKKISPAKPEKSNHRARRTASAPLAVAAAVPATARRSFPEGFTGLMYCDQLNCGGPMDVVRMQLPALADGHAPGSRRMNDVVYADVLIGSDGVARSIRIVQ